MESAENEVKLVVPSRIESLALINAVTEEVAEAMSFDEEARNAITISVVEAGTNAIQHGNREDASKPTEVRFIQENGRLVILIRDEGAGFDPDGVAVIATASADPLGQHLGAGRQNKHHHRFGTKGLDLPAALHVNL